MHPPNPDPWTTGTAVLITGASRGIGRATALYLVGAGLPVFAGVRQPSDSAKLVAVGGRRIRSLRLDVTDDESIAAARDEVDAIVGPRGLGGLVNNAAGGRGGPLEHVTRNDLEQIFAVNFHGVVLTTNAFLPLLKRGRGRIVNVGGGGSAVLAIPLMGAGSATKYAIEGMTDCLRVELRRLGIRVSLVEPGMTYAEADKSIFRAAMDADFDRALSRIPDDQKSHYGPALQRLREFNGSFLDRAAPPEVVARRIHHALTARRPRARYWCGREGKLAVAISRVGTSWMRDAIWGRVTGL